jgi:hypothetical protein
MPRGTRWAVYEFTKNGAFESGKKVAEFMTKEEAKERVCLLNGWQMK